MPKKRANYTEEEKAIALAYYHECRSAKKTVRDLGYPVRSCLNNWIAAEGKPKQPRKKNCIPKRGSTFEERLEIESMIFQRCSFGEIAKKINKDRSTISREIRRHSVIEKSGYSGFGFNACMHKETCKMGMVCGDKCVKTSCKLCTSIVK